MSQEPAEAEHEVDELRDNAGQLDSNVNGSASESDATQKASLWDRFGRLKPLVDETAFLWNAPAVLRWIVLSLFAYFSLALLIELQKQEGWIFVAGIFYITILAVVGTMFVVLVCVCCLAVVQDTASGYEGIQNWPDSNFTDWLSDSLVFIFAMFFGFIPGAVLGNLILYFGAPTWSVFCLGSLTSFLFFPFTLLSIEITESIFQPVSRIVWRSVRTDFATWRSFYIRKMALAAGCTIALLLMLPNYVWLSIPSASVIVLMILVYSRLLGRLLAEVSRDYEEVSAEESEVSTGAAVDEEPIE